MKHALNLSHESNFPNKYQEINTLNFTEIIFEATETFFVENVEKPVTIFETYSRVNI